MAAENCAGEKAAYWLTDTTGTKPDDSLMKVIGEHCPKLMELRLFRGKNRTIRSLMCTSWRDLRNSVCRRKTFTHELWQQKTEQVKRQCTDLLTQLEFIHQLNPVSQKSGNVWQNGYWIRWGPIHLDESYGHTEEAKVSVLQCPKIAGVMTSTAEICDIGPYICLYFRQKPFLLRSNFVFRTVCMNFVLYMYVYLFNITKMSKKIFLIWVKSSAFELIFFWFWVSVGLASLHTHHVIDWLDNRV